MVDLNAPEKKLLSEPCWIELGEDVKIRVDYPTRSQEVELRRLQKIWFNNLAKADTEHWIAYYLRSTIKEVTGFSIEGKPAQLVLERGLAKELTNGEKQLDLIATFLKLDIVETVGGMIMARLDVTDIDKKKQPSPPNSLKTESSISPGSSSKQEARSSMAGIPSTRRAKKT